MRAILPFAVLACLALAPAARAEEIVIDQAHMKFVPDKVTIHAGDTLSFKNSDVINHNIQVVNDDGDPVDLGLQHPGQVVTQTFAKAGEYEIRCTIHPMMLLTLSVK